MGYCMEQRDADFYIASKHKDAELLAIQNLAGRETIKDSTGSHFSWVDTKTFVEAKTLEEALDEWRWDIDQDDEGNVINISFTGEKIGSDHILLNAIAPFVKKGSYIEMQGEDGAMWRWVFSGAVCDEKYPEVKW